MSDRLLIDEDILAFATRNNEYCDLSVEVGEWVRDETLKAVGAHIVARAGKADSFPEFHVEMVVFGMDLKEGKLPQDEELK